MWPSNGQFSIIDIRMRWNLIQRRYKQKSYLTKPLISKDNERWLGLSERHNHNLCFIIKSCNFQCSYKKERSVFVKESNHFKMKPNLFVLKQQLLSFLNYTDKDFFLNEWMSIAIYSHLSMVNSLSNKWLSVSTYINEIPKFCTMTQWNIYSKILRWRVKFIIE